MQRKKKFHLEKLFVPPRRNKSFMQKIHLIRLHETLETKGQTHRNVLFIIQNQREDWDEPTVLSRNTSRLSGPILNNKSTILRLGRKPSRASNT